MQFLKGTISKNKSHISIYPPIISKERDVDFLSYQIISTRDILVMFIAINTNDQVTREERERQREREKEKTLSSKDNTDRRANR